MGHGAWDRSRAKKGHLGRGRPRYHLDSNRKHLRVSHVVRIGAKSSALLHGRVCGSKQHDKPLECSPHGTRLTNFPPLCRERERSPRDEMVFCRIADLLNGALLVAAVHV